MVAAAIRQAFLQSDAEAARQTWRHVAREPQKFADSPLEGDGFELLYRGTKAVDFRSIPGIVGVSAGLLNDTT
jgi:hypothetical protein